MRITFTATTSMRDHLFEDASRRQWHQRLGFSFLLFGNFKAISETAWAHGLVVGA